MADESLKVFPGSWPLTVVCGASGTGRTRFAYALAARYNGHVIDTGDVRPRRGQSPCEVFHTAARPWSDAVDRARSAMSDSWDYHNALG